MATLITGGSFTSDGAGKIIDLPGGADYFRVVNVTQSATTQATGRGVAFEWFHGVTADGAALETKKTNSTDALNVVSVTTGGFNYVTAFPDPEAPLTGTDITAADPAAATVTNTYSDDDKVLIYDVTGMKQISGMVFSISSVTSGGFDLEGLDASGFAAAATAFKTRRLAKYARGLPEALFITSISQASQAVIGVSTLHDYAVGMLIYIAVPSSYGMSEMDAKQGRIVAVGNYTITVDIDSSGFTAFAFPASAASTNLNRFAMLAPAGQKALISGGTQYGYNVNAAPFRQGQTFPYMYLASGAQSPAGSTSDVIVWQAFRYGN